ncbi:MAG: hypothetical protein ABI723_02915 [Bacteroidia bacterium]
MYWKISKTDFICITVFLIFLGAAFFQGYKSVSELNWGFNNFDSNRDMGFVHTILNGNYGQDPSYTNEYIWYNPLVMIIESAIVKITHFPVNTVVTKSGAFLNLLAPITFFLMMAVIFNVPIALAATTGFLFFNINDLDGWMAATYSPWLFPVSFAQTFFYTGIIIIYKAFKEWKLFWFILLGINLAFCFLAHTAPTLLLILITVHLSVYKIVKSDPLLKIQAIIDVIKKGLPCLVLFIVLTLPFTWFVVGKYKLHMINTYTYEYLHEFFQIKNVFMLFKANLSLSLLIAMYGCIYFFKMNKDKVSRLIVSSWIMYCIVLYIYTTAIVFIRYHFNIKFPGIVPSFHFFFYLKAAQALFFGVGVCHLLSLLYNYMLNLPGKIHYIIIRFEQYMIPLTMVLLVIINYNSYAHRPDFLFNRTLGLENNIAYDTHKVYEWIVSNADDSKVFLSNENLSDFPLLASGRKMVAVSPAMSSPYVDYIKRNNDRNKMLDILSGKESLPAEDIFKKYNVQYLLVNKNEKDSMPSIEKYFPVLVYSNDSYFIFYKSTY